MKTIKIEIKIRLFDHNFILFLIQICQNKSCRYARTLLVETSSEVSATCNKIYCYNNVVTLMDSLCEILVVYVLKSIVYLHDLFYEFNVKWDIKTVTEKYFVASPLIKNLNNT